MRADRLAPGLALSMARIQPLRRRLRRLRRSELLRDAVADVVVRPQMLIYPMFVGHMPAPRPVASMPGVSQWPVADAVARIGQLAGLGLNQFLLFGVTCPPRKDPAGNYAADPDAPVNRVISELRQADAPVVLHADLCLCEYTDHGHCGLLQEPDVGWVVDNDRTLDQLARTAVAQARAGADLVAPSGMMDGQVATIRAALDAAGFNHVAIMAYSAKYASNLYGPFREAGQGAMQFGDRRGYQMDFRRSSEWRRAIEADIAQGADIVMVKPALTYLDILHQVHQSATVPVSAFHVSGEYAMLHAAADRGWLEFKPAVMEQTTAIARAGADLILTYFAPQLVEWLHER